MNETLGIAGSGTIATGLAVTAASSTEVLLWARSEKSAERAREMIARGCAKAGDEAAANRVTVVTDLDELARATFLVEAIVEHHGSKAAVLSDLGELGREQSETAILATTTSSLSIAELAHESGHPERFVGLHVFNPVPRMKLVELAFPQEATEGTRERARSLCAGLGKTAVEVPDIAGFVVNRLLFPYLFNAVALMSENALAPQSVDDCMKLGAGMPMGPLALLDFVGLDVAQAIGESIGATVPPRLLELVDQGALGRKAKRGFYDYS
ncbi:MAG: 3-hydroxyacyl-CoA dehydrogenase family protein [Solirubrobacteraceae bacterium]